MNGKIQYGSARSLTVPATHRRSPRLADPARFPRVPHTPRTLVLVAASAITAVVLLAAVPRQVPGMTLALLGGAWVAFVLMLTLPSRAEAAGAELTRRLGRFRHAVNAVGDQPSRAELEGLMTFARELGLQDREVGDELSRIRAAIDAIDLRDQLAQGNVPIVRGVEALPSGDQCHFTCPVRFGRRRSDQFGHLLLTSGWLRFRGALDLSVSWSEVASVQRAAREIIVTLHASNRALRFGCHTIEESTRGGVIAEHLTVVAQRNEELDRHAAPVRGTPLAH